MSSASVMSIARLEEIEQRYAHLKPLLGVSTQELVRPGDLMWLIDIARQAHERLSSSRHPNPDHGIYEP